MQSFLREIEKLRKGRPLLLDPYNSNRYRLVATENDGTKTSYCFSSPIYNCETRQLVPLHFKKEERVCSMCGSNTNVTLAEDILLANREGFCRISLPERIAFQSKRVIWYGSSKLFPTVNGLAFQVPCTAGQSYEMTLISERPFSNVRANGKYFSLMQEEFRPFVTVSCIGTLNRQEQVIAPCEVCYQKKSDKAFTLLFRPRSSCSAYLMYEVNLYEPKLFQDTTVESLSPQENNAFGGVAFLGHTASYGEQWLYSRLDFSKISELLENRISRAILHLPKYTRENVLLGAFSAANRFCSVGSNWESRIPATGELLAFISSDGYYSLDITTLITDKHTHCFKPAGDLIFKCLSDGFTTVATGDSCFALQILEIHYSVNGK